MFLRFLSLTLLFSTLSSMYMDDMQKINYLNNNSTTTYSTISTQDLLQIIQFGCATQHPNVTTLATYVAKNRLLPWNESNDKYMLKYQQIEKTYGLIYDVQKKQVVFKTFKY